MVRRLEQPNSLRQRCLKASGILLSLFVSVALYSNVFYRKDELSPPALKDEETVKSTVRRLDPLNEPPPVSSSPRHAYAFLVAGCDPNDPTYLGGIYGVLVANEVLQDYNTTSDVIVMVRMAAATDAVALPPKVEALFQNAGIIVKYLPKPNMDNFYSIIMDKFHILRYTEYSRIIFFDTDVMPRCNFDYFFDLSEGENAVLRENFILATRDSPADAGFFMLKPNLDDFNEIQEIIQRREGGRSGYMDWMNGWGHAIKPPDKWVSKNFQGVIWKFYGAIADQGLLYHWTKYVKKSVSISINDIVETWGVPNDDEDSAQSKSSVEGSTNSTAERDVQLLDSSRVLLGNGCPNQVKLNAGNPPHRFCKSPFPPSSDYVHFCADTKPWYQSAPPPPNPEAKRPDPYRVWYETLERVLEKHGSESDIDILYDLIPTYGYALTDRLAYDKVKKDKTTFVKN